MWERGLWARGSLSSLLAPRWVTGPLWASGRRAATRLCGVLPRSEPPWPSRRLPLGDAAVTGHRKRPDSRVPAGRKAPRPGRRVRRKPCMRRATKPEWCLAGEPGLRTGKKVPPGTWFLSCAMRLRSERCCHRFTNEDTKTQPVDPLRSHSQVSVSG